MKPPLGLALAKFPKGFDPDMACQLRERDPLTLEDMQRGAISVEENLIEKRARLKSEKRVTYKDETMATTSSSDAKIDNLVRVMERMMEKINLNDRVPPRENQINPQNRNIIPNFRRHHIQNRPRDNDQQIRPPFQENYVDQEDKRETEMLEENHVNLIGSDSEGDDFLTEEEQGFFSSEQTENNHEDSEDYQLGFENAIMEVHRQYDLRRKRNEETAKNKKTETNFRNTSENLPKKSANSFNTVSKKNNLNKDKTGQPSVDPSCPSTSASGLEKSFQNNNPNKTQQIKIVEKTMFDKSDVNMSKTQVPFNLEGEIAKIKISIPLAELVT